MSLFKNIKMRLYHGIYYFDNVIIYYKLFKKLSEIEIDPFTSMDA